ncbi:tRNA glutamyl-Q(34) synthetase GluQRS [Halocynthiibacter styelae]|uniref:tRNA glutamyl-Q(34) synthetase GluQRS n=1 Tax=Halocynthiibacter styelae TaxID=2761955 RepID=A0A8J7IHN1_9RHOB|nr:tRNA glutamyl-Q(34) synthetase GluQRS [Paenihalocynthiibacter styelae]MBI1492308.1 tRNA glutamyl-Q(34) synthetase GluQRS [Paenihalocynthiibacter styelae]
MRTRFAPSPTGPLHLGHAYSAIAAHDMARAAGGQFLLRMEDTDLQRSKPEWDAQIIDDLTWLGLTWDGPVLRQSQQLRSYDVELNKLDDLGLLYPCSCSRADIRAALAAPQEGVAHELYPGTCKHREMTSRQPGDALRLHLDRALDLFQGPLPQFVETGAAFAGTYKITRDQGFSQIGDVVLSRKGEDIIAYFLASAIDDIRQGISHVVRGEDLFDFTQIQVILLTLLRMEIPIYHHHALIRDENGKRLAKRDDARAISKYREDGATPQDIRALVGL